MAKKTVGRARWKPTGMCSFSCREDENENMRIRRSELKADI